MTVNPEQLDFNVSLRRFQVYIYRFHISHLLSSLSYVFSKCLQINTPTIIKYDDHEFIFEGFSLLSHFPLQRLPTCKVIRFNLSYTILYIEEKIPDNFTIMELDLFCEYNFSHYRIQAVLKNRVK